MISLLANTTLATSGNPLKALSEFSEDVRFGLYSGHFGIALIAGRVMSGIKVAHRSFRRIDKFVLSVR